MKTRCLILFLIFLAFNNCTAKGEKAEIRYENGIKHIINPMPRKSETDKVLRLEYDREFSIDSESSELVGLGLTEIIGFEVDESGNIYILTARGLDKYAHIFSPRGEYRASFGRRGQGPGELLDPKYLELIQSTITILDFGRKKLVSYRIDGSFLGELSTPPNIRRATILANKNMIVLKALPDSEKGEINFPVVLCDERFQNIKILGPGRSMPIFAQARRIDSLNLRVDYETWQVFGDRVYVGDSLSGYDIRVYDLNGNLTLIISKKYNPIPISDEYKKRISAWMEKNANAYANKVVFPSFFPAFQYYFLDNEGRVFVMTYEETKKANDFFYDVFDANGFFVGRTQFDNIGILPSSPLNVPVPLKVVAKKDRVYYLREKENGYKELVVCKWK